MRQLFGIDIGGTNVKWAVVSENYEFGDRGSVPTAFVSADQLVDTLVALVEPYREQVVGVGISAPGGIFGYEVDPDGTIHRGGALPYMDGFPLGRALRTAGAARDRCQRRQKLCAWRVRCRRVARRGRGLSDGNRNGQRRRHRG